MIIAFDFDGTITKYNEYPKCGELRKGIKECIDKLWLDNHYIMIFTCRSTNTLEQLEAYTNMINYLKDNKIKHHIVNANINPNRHFNPYKPYWNILIDDSALGFNDDWTGEDIYNLINKKLKL